MCEGRAGQGWEPDVESMTDAWVRELACSPLVGTRRKLMREIVACREPRRAQWLALFLSDGDALIRDSADEALRGMDRDDERTLRAYDLEDLFLEGVRPEGFSWEWEFVLSVWDPRSGPRVRVVLLNSRDAHEARVCALATTDEVGARAFPPKGSAFIRSVRLVCEYTRSPRSMSEAQLWKHRGRPRPPFD